MCVGIELKQPRGSLLHKAALCVALFPLCSLAFGQYPSNCLPVGSQQCQGLSITNERFHINGADDSFGPLGKPGADSEEEAYAKYIEINLPCALNGTPQGDWQPAFTTPAGVPEQPFSGGVEIYSVRIYLFTGFIKLEGVCTAIDSLPNSGPAPAIWRERHIGCGSGYISSSTGTACERTGIDTGKSMCCSDSSQVNAGNPINIGIGNKFQVESDYVGQGPFPLRFSRTFNSGGPNTFVTTVFSPNLGNRWKYWRHTYDRTIEMVPSASINTVRAYRQDGRVLGWNLFNGQYVPESDNLDLLQPVLGAGGSQVGWSYRNTDDEVEAYDISGRLTSITNRAGLIQSLVYSDGSTSPSVAQWAGLLISVTDPLGKQLRFTYDSQGHMVTMADSAGGTYQYSYDLNGNVTSIAYPDSTVRGYLYENTSFPHALTGINDENGQRFATWTYDSRTPSSQGQAVSSENGLGANRVTISYDAGLTSVTDAFGVTRSFTSKILLGVAKNDAISGPACPSCGAAAKTYDANGFLKSRTDWNGNVTCFLNDARGLENVRLEGWSGACPADLTQSSVPGVTQSDQVIARKITTSWHPVFRLPVAIAGPRQIVTYIYNGDGGATCGHQADGVTLVPGVPCRKTITPTQDPNGSLGFTAPAQVGAPLRTWTYAYNANGSVLTVDGPRTDVADVTTYTYYAINDPDPGQRGNVATISNALGQTTSITAYNAHGQPTTIVDTNGLTTSLTYDARQRLTSRSVGGELTSYRYDGVGQLTQVMLPDGSSVSYSYDAAHRLTGMSDNFGDRIVYTLDAMGNRTQEKVFDPASQLAQTRSRVYNNLNRLVDEIGASNQTNQTTYAYDNQGNVISATNLLFNVTANQYDALDRLVRVTDPNNGVTRYTYNGIDGLVTVQDPRGLTTQYSYCDREVPCFWDSPDTGFSNFTYDEAGNLVGFSTLTRGATYTYDALNRPTAVEFDDADGNPQSFASYTYDQGPNAIGRLTGITETNLQGQVTSQTTYAYDQKGRTTSETRTINGVAYVLAYSYDGGGRLSGLTYPSGRTIAYGFDALGRISQVSTTPANGSAQVVASNIAYQPFGGVKSYTLGNGQSYSRSYDQDGRIASYSLGNQFFALGYDAASRISFIADAANPVNANTYGYDSLDRLTSAVLPNLPFAYNYDAVGNRLSKTVGSATDTYAYGATSNRLSAITAQAGATRSFSFDANGSTTNDAINQYVYDARGRLSQSVGALGATAYQVNALGQRIRKTNSTEDRVFLYDTRGRLIAETDPGGALKREYLYLNDIPLAVVQ